MSAFKKWLASQREGWTAEMEAIYIQEQNEKFEQVYKATAEFLGHYGVSLSWDGDHYRITNDHRLLDDVYLDRKSAYKEALMIVCRKYHELKG